MSYFNFWAEYQKSHQMIFQKKVEIAWWLVIVLGTMSKIRHPGNMLWKALLFQNAVWFTSPLRTINSGISRDMTKGMTIFPSHRHHTYPAGWNGDVRNMLTSTQSVNVSILTMIYSSWSDLGRSGRSSPPTLLLGSDRPSTVLSVLQKVHSEKHLGVRWRQSETSPALKRPVLRNFDLDSDSHRSVSLSPANITPITSL
jgi:hypothetical protein